MSIGDLLQAAGNVAAIGPFVWGAICRLSSRRPRRGRVVPADTLTIELRTGETAVIVSVTVHPCRHGNICIALPDDTGLRRAAAQRGSGFSGGAAVAGARLSRPWGSLLPDLSI